MIFFALIILWYGASILLHFFPSLSMLVTYLLSISFVHRHDTFPRFFFLNSGPRLVVFPEEDISDHGARTCTICSHSSHSHTHIRYKSLCLSSPLPVSLIPCFTPCHSPSSMSPLYTCFVNAPVRPHPFWMPMTLLDARFLFSFSPMSLSSPCLDM